MNELEAYITILASEVTEGDTIMYGNNHLEVDNIEDNIETITFWGVDRDGDYVDWSFDALSDVEIGLWS